MVKYIYSTFFLMSFISIFGQKLYKIKKDKYGEPLLNEKAQYSFTYTLNNDDLKKIDTTAFYKQVFEDGYNNSTEKKNPRIIIFHNDGFFKSESFLYFGKFSIHRNKKSIYYGGKYRINGNKIELERFIKSLDSKSWYIKNITSGIIEGNRIILNNKEQKIILERQVKL
ncbi:hypothetical protein AB4Y90_01560 [Chryseobacterium sp. 2TAF14]|uniref:hypothetical protein n=1 Tax=Chryseobacterium sp. 2TAF14 TaxID=3233007 RepID=UPI003F93BC0D